MGRVSHRLLLNYSAQWDTDTYWAFIQFIFYFLFRNYYIHVTMVTHENLNFTFTIGNLETILQTLITTLRSKSLTENSGS